MLHGTKDYSRVTYADKCEGRRLRKYHHEDSGDTPEQIAACLNCMRSECHPSACEKMREVRKNGAMRGEFVFGRKVRRYEYQGKMCTTAELAEYAGVDASTVRYRIRKGMPIDEDVHGPSQKYQYRGYRMTLPEIAELADVNLEGMRQLIYKRHKSAEEAVRTLLGENRRKARKKPVKTYAYRGEQHTIKGLAQIAGIAPDTIRYRIRHGWSIERAVETSVRGNEETYDDE